MESYQEPYIQAVLGVKVFPISKEVDRFTKVKSRSKYKKAIIIKEVPDAVVVKLDQLF